jgi:hypothetical protein
MALGVAKQLNSWTSVLHELVFLLTVCGSVLLAGGGRAEELRVDLTLSGRPDAIDPDFTSWVIVNGPVVSNTFNGISITFRNVGPYGTGLKGDWYKDGVTIYHATMADDGITVDNGNDGGQIEMRISGLASGTHTIATYHNTWQNPASHTFSSLNISVNGVLTITNFVPTNRVLNNYDASVAYMEVEAQEGQDVVILYQADTNNVSITDKNVCIDGIEIDTVRSTLKAIMPVPANRDEHVDADTGSLLLSWTASASSVTQDVYFGTSSNAVATATHASPEFQGSQTTNVWNATGLDSALTNYWRIDEVTATNSVFKGDLWYFRTRHLAFPGAEGYGRFARGGRGGVVMEVTNLNDSGPGSLRAAVEASGPRTVVFTVSGLITLESKLVLHNPYITVAGQTAPGKGVCMRKYNFGMLGAKDAIIRDVRVRPGNIAAITLDGMGMASSDHCIIDHCSVGWSIDEAVSSRSAGNITLQRTFISEALNVAGHTNYPPGTAHGYAASIGGMTGSFHHNLLAHCEGRNWSMAGGLGAGGLWTGRLDIRNNVVYNWGHRATDGGAMEVDFVNNYYKPGAATDYFFALNAQYDNFPGMQRYFFDGNVMPGHFDESNQADGRTATGTNGGSVPTNYVYWVDAPFFESYVATQSAGDAYKRVLSDVGCTQPVVDDHDLRVIQETRDGTYHYVGSVTGKPGLPDTQDDVGGWETYPELQRPADWDSDHDGLPDWWEVIHGTNPNSAPGDFSDSNADPDGDGYSNLEDYLNWLAAPHGTCTQDSYLDVDLSQLTIGFTNQPVYSVFSPTNGTVALLGDNKTARFTPVTNGLAAFSFAVTDAESSTLTNTIGVHVTPAVAPPLTAFQQWQVLYFTSTNNPAADPAADPDGDGQNNLAEFLCGTNPTNSLSALRILSVVRHTTDVVITWTTAGGFTNAVQATTGDSHGGFNTNFINITSPPHIIIPGSGDVTANYVDVGGATNSPSRYYRIRLVP